MACYLFDYDSNSSSDHNDFNYATPVRNKRVYRKIFDDNGDEMHETIDVDDIDDVVDNVGKKIGDASNSKEKEKMTFESDEDVNFGKKDDIDDNVNIGEENFGFNFPNMNDVVPYVGMQFDSLQEAETFYRNYGRTMGFEIIIRSSHKQKEGDDLASRMYICRKGGRLGSNTPNSEESKGKRTRDFISRTKCEARISLTHRVNLNKWEVTFVKLEHNHGMVTPDKVQFMQRSLNIDSFTRSIIDLFHKSGVETTKIMKLLSESCGGIQNLGFSNQDIRNVIRDIRRRVFDSGDAECGLALLREWKETCGGNFFYRVDVDDESRVRGLVWVDSRSVNAYKNFGDVVTFDSTYRTNRYCMPFIPITGVNHHYQNILFGFALIRDEKETSYKWVLETWLEAVDNKHPVTIITDQDIALGNAIAAIMPQTNHTYCTWHISKKFPEKLSSLYTRFPDFKKDFNSCVYKSLSPTEFEGSWEVLVEKYGLENHVWLNEMYAIRRQWIRAYTKQFFSAGMTTTSRSESMNSFFDEYVKASTGLKEFIENSQKALEKQYLNEIGADHETEYKERGLLYNSSLETHASMIYTKEMYKHFQNELLKSGSFIVKSVKHDGISFPRIYLVEKSTVPENCRKRYTLSVAFDGTISCACKKFEHSGMICRHMIRYLNKKQKTNIPQECIKLRWTMNGNKVAGPLPYTPPVHVNVFESQTARYSSLCNAFQSLGAIGSVTAPRYHYLMDWIEKKKVYINESFPEEKRNERMNESFHHEGEYDHILDPPMSQTKGRKKAGRYKSGIETSTSTKKPRICGKCKMEGANHDRRNCPNNPA